MQTESKMKKHEKTCRQKGRNLLGDVQVVERRQCQKGGSNRKKEIRPLCPLPFSFVIILMI